MSTDSRHITVCELSPTSESEEMHLSREGPGSLLISLTELWSSGLKIVTALFSCNRICKITWICLFYDVFHITSVLMDGLTFTQTQGAPFGQGARNVLPMHERTGACGLCTEGESRLGPGDPPQRARHPLPPDLWSGWGLAVLDNVACDNRQSKSSPRGAMSLEMRNFNHSFLQTILRVFLLVHLRGKNVFYVRLLWNLALYKTCKMKPQLTWLGDGIFIFFPLLLLLGNENMSSTPTKQQTCV